MELHPILYVPIDKRLVGNVAELERPESVPGCLLQRPCSLLEGLDGPVRSVLFVEGRGLGAILLVPRNPLGVVGGPDDSHLAPLVREALLELLVPLGQLTDALPHLPKQGLGRGPRTDLPNCV